MRLLFVGVLVVGLTGVGMLMWRSPGRSMPPAPAVGTAPEAGTEVQTPRRLAAIDLDTVEEVVSHRDSLDPLAYVEALIRLGDPNALGALVTAYADWAGDPEARAARERILEFLSSQEDVRASLALLISAAAADPTPVEKDPLWSTLKDRTQRLWAAKETRTWGRDRMLMQSNVRSQRLLASTLMAHCTENRGALEESERADLAGDLVSIYYQSKDEGMRGEILDGIAPIGGASAAALMEDPTARTEEEIAELEAAARALSTSGESASEEITRIANKLIADARQPDIDRAGFIEAVSGLSALRPDRLGEIAGAPILAQDEEAKAFYERTLDRAGY